MIFCLSPVVTKRSVISSIQHQIDLAFECPSNFYTGGEQEAQSAAWWRMSDNICHPLSPPETFSSNLNSWLQQQSQGSSSNSASRHLLKRSRSARSDDAESYNKQSRVPESKSARHKKVIDLCSDDADPPNAAMAVTQQHSGNQSLQPAMVRESVDESPQKTALRMTSSGTWRGISRDSHTNTHPDEIAVEHSADEEGQDLLDGQKVTDQEESWRQRHGNASAWSGNKAVPDRWAGLPVIDLISDDVGDDICNDAGYNSDDDAARAPQAGEYYKQRHRRRREERAPFKEDTDALKHDLYKSDLSPLVKISTDLSSSSFHPSAGDAEHRFTELLSYANEYTSAYGLESFIIDNFSREVWNNPNVLCLLEDLARHHVTFNPWAHQRDGVFEHSSDLQSLVDRSGNTFKLYLRFLHFPTRDALLDHVDLYEKHFPADVMLPASLRAACANVSADQALYVPYAGITCAGAAEHREESDHQDTMSQSRRANFIGDRRMDVFEITSLRMALKDDKQWRTDRTLSHLEQLLVSLLHSRTLNAAHGGAFIRPALSPRQEALKDKVHESLSTSPHFEPDTSLASTYENISRAEDSLLRSLSIKLPCAKGRQLVQDLATSWSMHSSRVDSVLILKDNTDECLAGEAAFWSLQAGPGPSFSRHLWNQLYGRDSAHQALSRQDVAMSFFSIIDLFSKDRDFHRLFVHCALLSLKLYWLKPRVVSIESSRVWEIVSSGFLTKWMDFATEEQLDEIFHHFNTETLLVIMHKMEQEFAYPTWDSIESLTFFENIGHPAAVQVAPNTWVCAVPSLHNGAWKRDPMVSAQYVNLFAASRLSFMVAVDAAIVVNKGHSRDDILHVNASITERLLQLGLTEELSQCCDELRRLLTALKSLQVSAAPKAQPEPLQSQRESISQAMQRVGTAYKLEGTIGSAHRVQQVMAWTQEARCLYEEGNLSHPLLRLVLEDRLPGTLEWAEQAIYRYCIGESLRYISSGSLARDWDQRTPEQRSSDARRRNERAQKAHDARTHGTRGRTMPSRDYLLEVAASCNPKKTEKFIRQCPSATCSAGTWMSIQACFHACTDQPLDDFLSSFAWHCPGDGQPSLMAQQSRPEEVFFPRLSTPARQSARAHLARLGMLDPSEMASNQDLASLKTSIFPTDRAWVKALEAEGNATFAANLKRDKATEEAYRKANKPSRGARGTREEQSDRIGKPYNDGNLLTVPTGRSHARAFKFLNWALAAPHLGQFLQDQFFTATPPKPFHYSRAKEYLPPRTHKRLLKTFGTNFDFRRLGYVVWLVEDEAAAATDLKIQDQLYSMLRNYAQDIGNALVSSSESSMQPISKPGTVFADRLKVSPAFVAASQRK